MPRPELLGLLLTATLASACGASHSVAGPPKPTAPSTSVPTCAPATTIVSDASVSGPSDARLGQPWATPGYYPSSQALGHFRVDPAPPSMGFRLSANEAIAIANRSGDQNVNAPGTRTIARFGLFTGNLVIVGNDANHTLMGSRRVTGVPAWLVVTDGAPAQTGGPPPAPGTSTPRCQSLAREAETLVVADADGQQLANLSGGGFPPVR